MSVEKRRFQDIRIDLPTLTGEQVLFKDNKVPTKIVLLFDEFPRSNNIYKDRRRRLPHTFIMKDPLVQYYRHKALRWSAKGVEPIYSVPPFTQRGHGIGSSLAIFFDLFDQ